MERLAASLADRYRIERELGAGGMATVYLAEDLKHKRKVAIKVLKPELAAVLGAERFVQEITTTAALSHPHILPLFDSGEAGGFLYYVMPYLQGETIREKLNRETQFGIEEAVSIATEVADALDYAHQNGVIHRDIKPENILLHNGRPMVMDFGIALAVSAAAGGRMTETGLSLGTPHYMSPEQATADKEITARSDVYSLASVLYEMLAGVPPHEGGSAQQTIMRIITETPKAVSDLRRSVPPNVAAALAKALEKLPADRFATAGEFRVALLDAGFANRAAGVGMAPAGGRVLAPTWALGSLVALLVLATSLAAWGWFRPRESPRVLRYELGLAGPEAPSLDFGVPVAAPDGSYVIWIGRSANGFGTQLWIKYRDAADAIPLAGSANAASFALSPDGAWVAFAFGGTIRKMPVGGGGSVSVVSSGVLAPSGLAWLDDGTIVYIGRVSDGSRIAELRAVSSDGGDAATVWTSDQGLIFAPSPLPGGRGVLVSSCSTNVTCDLWAVDLQADSAHVVVAGGQLGVVASIGQLLYTTGGSSPLLAAPFDPDRLKVTGNPIPVIDDLWDGQGYASFSLSRHGTMVVVQGRGRIGREFEMVWVDRTGREAPVDSAWTFRLTAIAGNYGWALSPDGSKVAIGLNTDAGDDIWIKNLRTGVLSRMTSDPGSDARPRWNADGATVMYISDRVESGAYQRRADGVGPETLLRAGVINEVVRSRDGQWLLTREGVASAAAGGRDITAIRAGDSVATPLVATPFDETAIALSPDGRWLAYASDEAGRSEIILRPFPEISAGKFQVSTRGGEAPLWSRDGRELFYLGGTGEMMSMRLSNDPSQPVGPTTALFKVRPELLGAQSTFYTPWDVAADGRFLMARMLPASTGPENRVFVVENFIEELRARVKP